MARTPRPQAEYRYHKQWKLDRARGQQRTTDAAPVAAHVNQLLAEGWSLRGIAVAAGINVSGLQHIARGDHARCKRATAGKVLAVTPAAILRRPDRDGFVRKDGAVRRVEALLAVGWRHSDITAAVRGADAAVRTESQVVLHQRGDFICRATHDAVAAAYDRLSMTVGPSTVTAQRARRLGYLPPLAWDDDTIDLPGAAVVHSDSDAQDRSCGDGPLIDAVAVERAANGDGVRITRAEKAEVVQRLTAAGYSSAQIADRLGVSQRTIVRKRAAA